MLDAEQARQWFVGGRVQGVGFRWWTRSRALELGLSGYARNLRDGRVEVFAQGQADSLDALDSLLQPVGERKGRASATGSNARPGEVTFATGRVCQSRPEVVGFTER